MRFLHSGHIGDLIAFLPCMRALGGGDLVITDNAGTNLSMEGFKYDSVKPLLEVQDYVHSVSYARRPEGIDYDVCGFRRYWGQGSIIEMQAKELGIPVPYLSAWINVQPDPTTVGRIVCCRTHRYRTDRFPWAQVVDRFRDKIIFIGLYDEYGDFTKHYGHVDQLCVRDLLELAQLIAGSDLFIGNQSSPFWIAAGMNHPLVQETHQHIRDSVVPYDTAFYSEDGSFERINNFIKKTIDGNLISK